MERRKIKRQSTKRTCGKNRTIPLDSLKRACLVGSRIMANLTLDFYRNQLNILFDQSCQLNFKLSISSLFPSIRGFRKNGMSYLSLAGGNITELIRNQRFIEF